MLDAFFAGRRRPANASSRPSTAVTRPATAAATTSQCSSEFLVGIYSPDVAGTVPHRHARTHSSYSPGEARKSLIAYLNMDTGSSYESSRPTLTREVSDNLADKSSGKTAARSSPSNAESGAGFLASVWALGFARERRSYAASMGSSANMDEFMEDDDDDDDDEYRDMSATDKGKKKADGEDQCNEQGGSSPAAASNSSVEQRSLIIDLPVAAPAAALVDETKEITLLEAEQEDGLLAGEIVGANNDTEISKVAKIDDSLLEFENMLLVDTRPHHERSRSKSYSKLRTALPQVPLKSPSLGKLRDFDSNEINTMLRQDRVLFSSSGNTTAGPPLIVVEVTKDDLPPEAPSKSPRRRRSSVSSINGLNVIKEVEKIEGEEKAGLAVETGDSTVDEIDLQTEDLGGRLELTATNSNSSLSYSVPENKTSSTVRESVHEMGLESTTAKQPTTLERRLSSAFRRDSLRRSLSVFTSKKDKEKKGTTNYSATILPASAATELTPPPTPRAMSVADGQDQVSIAERPKSRMSMFTFKKDKSTSKEATVSIADTTDSAFADLSSTLASSSVAFHPSPSPGPSQELQRKPSYISVSSSAKMQSQGTLNLSAEPPSQFSRTDVATSAAQEENNTDDVASEPPQPKPPIRRPTFRAFSTTAAKVRTQSWFSTGKLKTNEKGELIDPENDDNADKVSVALSTDSPSTPTKSNIMDKPKFFRTPTLGLRRPNTAKRENTVSTTTINSDISLPNLPSKEPLKSSGNPAARMKGLVRAATFMSKKKDKGKAKAQE